MAESPEFAVVMHELGGMLSSVQGFAHIAETNPDHPDRERYIRLTASEARRAARALKDLHLLRALDRGSVVRTPRPVPLKGLGLEGDVAVAVDPAKLSGLLERALAQATGPPEVHGARVTLPLAPRDDCARLEEALAAPYPDMIVLAVLRRLLRYWGGDVELGVDGERTVATIAFPEA